MAAIAFMVQSWAGCVADSSERGADQAEMIPEKGETLDGNGCRIVRGTEQIMVGKIGVTMKVPDGQPAGDLLLLPAWDDSEAAWCTKTRICTKALKRGYRVVMPLMGKSMYCREVYPETRADWASEATYAFVQDTLLSRLQEEYCLFVKEGNNFVIGVGAGARGAVRLLQEVPDLFDAAAAMSGDYNPSLNPRDNLYRGFLGDFNENSNRWQEKENLCSHSDLIQTPIYLAHGLEDNYVPSVQTENFYHELLARNKKLEVKYNLVPEKGHGYVFWSTQINEIFHFFETATTAHAEAP